MKYLTLHQAIFIHDKMLEKIGGSKGYNKTQISYLSSALENIKNDLYYPTMADKLAHLTHSCIKFHPFTDGNKRSGAHVMLLFLAINGIELSYTQQELIDIILSVADNRKNCDDLFTWLIQHER